MKAVLLLEDGTTYEGESIGANGTTIGEAVFATGMTGYQEMLTDPSFAGQLLTLTYPLIGNYGVNSEDVESGRIQVEGVIVRELCEEPSNWRSTMSLREYLASNGIVSMQGIDTRALTRKLRIQGVMMGAISTELTVSELKNELEKAPKYGSINFAERVSAKEAYEWTGDGCGKPLDTCHIVLVDMGFKYDNIRSFTKEGCRITVLPWNSAADDILRLNPDGVVLSSGPGDPRILEDTVNAARQIIGKKPIMGIGLGHQILGMALGGDIIKLKFGHRGANQPVKNIITGKVSITAQNHGYAVDPDKLSNDVQVTHTNLNDGTVEGLRHKHLPIFSIQYCPEAADGSQDGGYLLKEFVDNVMGCKNS